MIFEKRKEETLENGDKVIYCSYKEAMELKQKYPNATVELKDHIVNSDGLDTLVCIIPKEYPRITEGEWDFDEYRNTSPGLKNYVWNYNDSKTFHEQHMGGGGDEEYSFIKGLIEVDTYAVFNEIKSIELFPLCTKTTVTIKKEDLH